LPIAVPTIGRIDECSAGAACVAGSVSPTPVQVTLANGDVITYTIDGRGRRVGKSINGTRIKSWLYADHAAGVIQRADSTGDGAAVAQCGPWSP
jgi:YD repeat-containing protein